eukprot:TRINITY_DN23204_c0_g1_i2.p1 TRINITY_DN23204_c0_g1~~TRINITY_DN23204_c0_g1_i2.p1  ORF type:complete len:417 (+),score=75.63 TRINITY_DN23204_c0_g1_i2:59-1252(+)
MVNVLWGVACMTLDEQCTAGDVLAKFRKQMNLEDWPAEASCRQSVNLYRLVPVTDDAGCWFAEQEQLLVHLPGAAISCEGIEDLYQQLEQAEIRCERSRESVMALVDALHSREGSSGCDTSRLLAPEVREDLLERLRQENIELRHKLELSEYSRRASEERGQSAQECHAALMREFSLLVQEVTSRPTPLVRQQAPSPPAAVSAPAAAAWDGPAAAAAFAAGAAGQERGLRWPPRSGSGEEAEAPAAQPAPQAHALGASAGNGNGGGGNGALISARVPQLRLPTRTLPGQSGAGQMAGSAFGQPHQARVAYGGTYVGGPVTDRSSDKSSHAEAWSAAATGPGAAEAPAASPGSVGSAVGSVGLAAASAAAAAAAAGRTSVTASAKAKVAPLRLSGLRS